MSKIIYSTGKEFKEVVDHGFEVMRDDGCQGFEYTVAHIKGGHLKVVFEPESGSFDSSVVDGVEGFGYTLAFEEK